MLQPRNNADKKGSMHPIQFLCAKMLRLCIQSISAHTSIGNVSRLPLCYILIGFSVVVVVVCFLLQNCLVLALNIMYKLAQFV